ncbi:MAG: DUF1156 domain-containing protein [Bacteroidetes bacterium]|nr:DUF1156 domain-containing protein [Bacteroidota bacterium]
MHDKRFIKESFPVKEVSFYSAKEKNIRHGHISTLCILTIEKNLNNLWLSCRISVICVLSNAIGHR